MPEERVESERQEKASHAQGWLRGDRSWPIAQCLSPI